MRGVLEALALDLKIRGNLDVKESMGPSRLLKKGY